MNRSITKFIRGFVSRKFRKLFHKKWDVVDHGAKYFQEFSDIYSDTINDMDTAERFFKDFMEETQGWVIVDFIDTDNWDCIRKIEVDKENRLIWFFWQIPSGDILEEEMRRMIFPFGYYGICLKFDNVRFVQGKGNKCIGIIVNGYTIREKNIKGLVKNGGWNIKCIDSQSSFFSTNVVREKDGVMQFWRFINTPITSFWIVPKQLNLRPQDSEKLLYFHGAQKCKKDLQYAFNKIKNLSKHNIEKQRQEIKSIAHDMRIVAESLFKLIMCFYQAEYKFKVSNYDDLVLDDLTGPLKKNIYTSEFEKERIDEIPRLANDLSHDSGNPIDFKDIGILYMDITIFIDDFNSRIKNKGCEIQYIHSDKPSPHDYVKDQYRTFCFLDNINDNVCKTTGKISFKINAQIGTFIDFFNENGDDVLCKDGYIRNTKEEGHEALKVWDRNEVVNLLDSMYQNVISKCKISGYDTETYSLGLSFEAKLKKESTPSHLFTEGEIEQLMRGADDSKSNKLVIDEDGYAHIIQEPRQGHLYPVSIETWCAGNMYVGANSSLSDLHDSYVLCMHLWLAYLETGRQMYDDIYVSDEGLDKVIEEVKKYYQSF